ncbi:gas vesicle protein [Actinomadura gamaensis]|uniref:Gas vesicle protein n=1 Tax=Actinomadura gamaensis TaxID=1763541 RepID=A0ABV9U628_9ACTN
MTTRKPAVRAPVSRRSAGRGRARGRTGAAPARGRGTASGGSNVTESARRAAMTSAKEAAREAVEQVAGLTGRDPEGVVGIERTDDGWAITVEVVETHRIPDSADILACYRVELTADGDLAGYHRIQRYARGHVDGRHRT